MAKTKILTLFLLLVTTFCEARISEEPTVGIHVQKATSCCLIISDFSKESQVLNVNVELRKSSATLYIYKDGILVSKEDCWSCSELFTYDLSQYGEASYEVFIEDKDGLHFVQSIEVGSENN